MPKVKISEYSATANSNTDVASINIDEGCAPSGINNAIRAVMGHLKDFQQGTYGDPFNGPVNGALNGTVGATTPNTGAFTTLSATGNVTLGDASTDTLNVGNGGLVKDASGNVGIGPSSPAYKLDVTGTINSGASTATGYNLVFRTSGITTGRAQTALTNTSGDFYTGIEGSTAGATVAGSAAYSAFAGTFTANPLYFVTNGVIRTTIDSSGNLGLGVTPNTWNANNKVFQLSNNAALFSRSAATGLSQNLFYNSSDASAYIANGYATLYYQTSGQHQWYTGPSGTANATPILFTQAMTLDASGNLLVGTTTSASSRLCLEYTGASLLGQNINDSDNTNNSTFVQFQIQGTQVGTIKRVGTTSAVIYNTTSDYRLKTVTGAVTGQGDRIDALKPIVFQWKEGGQQAKGFLAHEFQEVYASSVSGDKDAVDVNGNFVYQAMQASTSEVIADLVAEIQSLRKRLAAANL